MEDKELTAGGGSTETERPKKSKKKGVPLFSEQERARIVQEALSAPSMKSVADKYRIRVENIYRWRDAYEKKNGPSPGANGGTVPEKGFIIPVHDKTQDQEIDILHKLVGKLTVENERLKDELRRRR